MFCHFNRTEDGFVDLGGGAVTYSSPSSCMIEARWAFGDSASSGKYATPFEAYRFNRPFVPSGAGNTFDYGHSLISTKTRLRGRGKSVRFRFYSSPGKDFQLIAWGMPVSAGGRG